jgi:anti-sigma factor RsiW
MSHVDEGTLHAMVDNALTAAERADVDAHLAACSECAARLTEARGLAVQTLSLLAMLDEQPLPARIVPAAPVTPAVPRGASAGRAFWTLRRVAMAASVMLVAGVSYEVGKRNDSAPAPVTAELKTSTPLRAPSANVPSVVEAAPGAVALPAAPTVQQRVRGGPRTDAEAVVAEGQPLVAERAAPTRALAITPPVPAAPVQAPVQRAPDSDVAAEQQRGRAESESRGAADRLDQSAGRRAPMSDAASGSMSQAAPAATQDVQRARVSQSSEPVQKAQAPGAARPVIAYTPVKVKRVELPGYTAVEEDSLPAITRRRYVSSAGTPLVLVIAQSSREPKAQRSNAESVVSEFVVTTANGRSVVRWFAHGLAYELAGALAPDSLVKLATHLKQ